jgi:sugar phosphate isomerase/epimerase
MKLSVVIAHADALANAFVVWRGFEQSMRKAAEMGYDGVELALRHPDEIDRATLRTWLTETGLEVSCVSTGQVFASLGVSLTDPDPKARMTSKEMFAQFIDLASEFGQKVNIGRIRGEIASRDREEVERLFVEATRDL